MEKVWIFGDSFTTEFYSTKDGKLYKENVWPWMLKKNYNVYNPSLCGTGPLTMLNLFLHQGKKSVIFYDWEKGHDLNIKNEYDLDTENTSVLFFISSVNRVHLNFLQTIQHQCLLLDIERTQYNKYKNFIKFLHNHYFTPEWYEDNITFILTTLFYLSKIYKKILIFPLFEKEHEIINSNFLKFIPIPENCHIVNRCLRQLTSNHIANPPEYTSDGHLTDSNPNHILQEKHIHLYNFLNEYIKTCNLNYNELDKLKI